MISDYVEYKDGGLYWKKTTSNRAKMGKTINLGGFDNEEGARSAYLKAKGAYS